MRDRPRIDLDGSDRRGRRDAEDAHPVARAATVAGAQSQRGADFGLARLREVSFFDRGHPCGALDARDVVAAGIERARSLAHRRRGRAQEGRSVNGALCVTSGGAIPRGHAEAIATRRSRRTARAVALRIALHAGPGNDGQRGVARDGDPIRGRGLAAVAELEAGDAHALPAPVHLALHGDVTMQMRIEVPGIDVDDPQAHAALTVRARNEV